MCGLVGIAGPGINTWDIDVLKDLATIIVIRGTDSSGVLQAEVDIEEGKVESKYLIEKAAHGMEYFKWYHEYQKGGNRKLFSGTMNNIFAVHVRAATKGFVTHENAHPFDVGNTVGMHNGTLVEQKFQHKKKTDSELLIKEIDEKGVIPALQEVRNPYSAYALVLWHKDTGKLTFVRNKERPLFFCYSAARDVIYWASEDWMLRGIMKRQRERIHNETIYFFKEDHVYTIDPTSYMKKVVEKDFEIKEVKKDYYRMGPRYGHNMVDWHGWSESEQEIKRLPAPKREENKGNILEFKKNDNKIPKIKCVGCEKELNLVQAHFATKISQTTVVCEECQKEMPFDAMRPEEVVIH